MNRATYSLWQFCIVMGALCLLMALSSCSSLDLGFSFQPWADIND